MATHATELNSHLFTHEIVELFQATREHEITAPVH